MSTSFLVTLLEPIEGADLWFFALQMAGFAVRLHQIYCQAVDRSHAHAWGGDGFRPSADGFRVGGSDGKCVFFCDLMRFQVMQKCKICKVPSTETGSCFVVYRTVNVEQECRPMRTSWKDSLRRWVPMCCPVFMETWCCLVMERNDMSPYHMFFECITLMSILWRIKVLMMMMIIIIIMVVIIIIMVVIMLMLPLVHIGLPRLPLPPRRNLPDQIGLWSQQLGIFQFGASDAHGFALQRATTWHSTLLLHATGAALAILVIFVNSKNVLKWIACIDDKGHIGQILGTESHPRKGLDFVKGKLENTCDGCWSIWIHDSF